MKLGLQMYTVRDSLKADPLGTIEKVAAAGYQGIEFANKIAEQEHGTGWGISAADLKKTVDGLGIEVVGSHFRPSDMATMGDSYYRDYDQIKQIADFYRQVGAHYLSIPIDIYPNKDYLLKRCETYNKCGEICKSLGIQLLYHNHYNEFQYLEGETMLDIMLANTDPELLGLEIDAYWMLRGLFDPAKTILEYGDRVHLLHIKDFPLSQVDQLNLWKKVDRNVPVGYKQFIDAFTPDEFTEIGEGIIKVQEVVNAGNAVGAKYIFVEQDYNKIGEIESIKRSSEAFHKMNGMEF